MRPTRAPPPSRALSELPTRPGGPLRSCCILAPRRRPPRTTLQRPERGRLKVSCLRWKRAASCLRSRPSEERRRRGSWMRPRRERRGRRRGRPIWGRWRPPGAPPLSRASSWKRGASYLRSRPSRPLRPNRGRSRPTRSPTLSRASSESPTRLVGPLRRLPRPTLQRPKR